MNNQTILTTSCTDFTGCFSKRPKSAIVQQYTSTILIKKIILLLGNSYSIHMLISMRSDISSVVRIPNAEYGFTEYGKRNYIFRWEFMLISISD